MTIYQAEISALKALIYELTKGIKICHVALLDTQPCMHEECKQEQTEELDCAINQCKKLLKIKE